MSDDPACTVGGLARTERLQPPEPAPGPRLVVVAADGTWSTRDLAAATSIILGRGPDADVRVDEAAVSRRHARIDIGDGGYHLTDLGSANGTIVGSEVVRSRTVALRPGQPIVLGRTLIVVPAPPGAQPPDAAPSVPAPGSPAMRAVDELVARAAPTLVSVLLVGETGVGKDVVAERLHRLSSRGHGPLMRLNCASLDPALLESELFGHERGAFTGAAQAKPGLLEVAAGGTLFLDEIGEMPLEVQAKLLLVVEQRVMRRVGASRFTPVDVRFVYATHRDLEAEIRHGRFRADFYYRINGITIRIPPLRQRLDELPGLLTELARDATARLQRPRPPRFDDDALARLRRHSWPGNIRELRAVIERAVLLADDVVTLAALDLAGLPGAAAEVTGATATGDDGERERVIAALVACGGNQSRAARMLGIARNTLIARIRRYGLQRPRGPEKP